MADYPLIVFAAAQSPIPLSALRDMLITEGSTATFGVEIAGEATDEQLADLDWEAAFMRWQVPEIHEVALIERMVRAVDEEAERLIASHLKKVARLPDVAGRLIVADYLNRTQTVYAVQILPALLAEDNHEAWGALDVLLRFMAQSADAVIYADSEGYCDAEGELLLSETDELNPVSVDALDLPAN